MQHAQHILPAVALILVISGCNAFSEFPESRSTNDTDVISDTDVDMGVSDMSGPSDAAGSDATTPDAEIGDQGTDMESDAGTFVIPTPDQPIHITFSGGVPSTLGDATHASVDFAGNALAFTLSDSTDLTVWTVTPDNLTSGEASAWNGPVTVGNLEPQNQSSIEGAVRASDADGTFSLAVTALNCVQGGESLYGLVGRFNVFELPDSIMTRRVDDNGAGGCTASQALREPTFLGGRSGFDLSDPGFALHVVWADSNALYSLPEESLDDAMQDEIAIANIGRIWGTTGSLAFFVEDDSTLRYWHPGAAANSGAPGDAGVQLGDPQNHDFAHVAQLQDQERYIAVRLQNGAVEISLLSYVYDDSSQVLTRLGEPTVIDFQGNSFRPRVAAYPGGFAVFVFEERMQGGGWHVLSFALNGSQVIRVAEETFTYPEEVIPTAVDFTATRIGNHLWTAALVAWTRGGGAGPLWNVERVQFPNYYEMN